MISMAVAIFFTLVNMADPYQRDLERLHAVQTQYTPTATLVIECAAF
jgi:hypothetical protein